MRLLCTHLQRISPTIAHLHLGDPHELLALVDEYLSGSQAELSGVISDGGAQGKLIEKNTMKTGRMVYLPERPSDDRLVQLYDFLLARGGDYMKAMRAAASDKGGGPPPEAAPEAELALERVWAIDQKENDYQVLHAHVPNVLSGIIYLETPPGMNTSTYPDGILTLIENNPFVVLPSPGDMYVWPAYMLHHVYPFRGKGRRVAISFNLKDKRRGHDAPVYFAPTYVSVSRDQYYGRAAPPPVLKAFAKTDT